MAHAHLAAFDKVGYELRASYATKWSAIDYFSERVTWIDLGGGIDRSSDDGLARFKRGWCTETRMAWLCGRVLQPAVYTALSWSRTLSGDPYFPRYRQPAGHSSKASSTTPFAETDVSRSM